MGASANTTDVKQEYPDHIPMELVRDIDIYEIVEPGEDAQQSWKRLQTAGNPIIWTPHNGGHWIVTRANLIEQIQTNYKSFSHREILVPPHSPPVPTMILMDPPDHGPLRNVILPALSQKALESLEWQARDTAKRLVMELAPRGECEFISEFAQVLPIVVFLGMMGLPQEDREMLLPYGEVMVRSGDSEKRQEAQAFMAQYISKWIDQRLKEPGDDLVSHIAHAKVGERAIEYPEILGMNMLLLFGGLDTVASMIGFIARFLALNSKARSELSENPEIIPAAIEELIRRHGLSNTCRYVVEDMDFAGVHLKSGDMIQAPNCLYGLDEDLHVDPMTVDFNRSTARKHAAFGKGPHLCPGAPLARREIKVFLEEWLKVIPNFKIKPGSVPKIKSGMVNAVRELHLCWEV